MYSFRAVRVPEPDTGNLVFMPFNSLPGYSVTGPGINCGGFSVLQGPQLYYQQEQVLDGANGIPVGSPGSSGLIDLDKYMANIKGANNG